MVLETITGQIEFSAQYPLVWVTQSVIARYTDSLPGIILFFVIVIGKRIIFVALILRGYFQTGIKRKAFNWYLSWHAIRQK